jgi:hypothetical protein
VQAGDWRAGRACSRGEDAIGGGAGEGKQGLQLVLRSEDARGNEVWWMEGGRNFSVDMCVEEGNPVGFPPKSIIEDVRAYLTRLSAYALRAKHK